MHGRIRLPFAAAFILLCLAAAYIGLTPLQLGEYVDDKVLHFVTFFILTIAFYWIVDARRREILMLTLVACTFTLGVGSEFLQAFIPNGRNFDLYDIVANVVGSLLGLLICSQYHKRMLDRRRRQRELDALAGAGDNDDDVELGIGVGRQQEGVDSYSGDYQAHRDATLEEEVDNWDENALDAWDDDEDAEGGGPSASAPKSAPKKRTD